MPPSLHSIVYVSTATRTFSTQELEMLYVEVHRLNEQNAITGVLLYNDGNIMQCFEGPTDAVHDTYHRIQRSTRHKNLIELMNEAVTQRSFAAWKMGVAQPTRSELLQLTTARWKQLDSEAPPGSVPPGFDLLRAFWRDARRGA